MASKYVQIDFQELQVAFTQYIREKAAKHHSTIVCKVGCELIEEDPKTEIKKLLKPIQ